LTECLLVLVGGFVVEGDRIVAPVRTRQAVDDRGADGAGNEGEDDEDGEDREGELGSGHSPQPATE
jgi:hypothetical protein